MAQGWKVEGAGRTLGDLNSDAGSGLDEDRIDVDMDMNTMDMDFVPMLHAKWHLTLMMFERTCRFNSSHRSHNAYILSEVKPFYHFP